MALVFALAIAVVVLATCGLFVVHPWWFPASISAAGTAIDRQFTATFIVCGILLALAQLTLACFVWRYRSGGAASPRLGQRAGADAPADLVADRNRVSREGARLERVWAAAMAMTFLGLGAMGYRVWAQANVQEPAGPGALRVEAWGEQFAWYFRYPGPDGQFGPIHPDLMSDGMANYLGLDREHDAASRDDLVTATLAVPAGVPVELMVRSKDVIHSFFVRELRLKQDAIPGKISAVHFTAERPGRYEIVCSELCGLGHYKMHADLRVMTADQFQKWLVAKASQQ
jgi:cytochrome c oxidase subunit 2